MKYLSEHAHCIVCFGLCAFTVAAYSMVTAPLQKELRRKTQATACRVPFWCNEVRFILVGNGASGSLQCTISPRLHHGTASALWSCMSVPIINTFQMILAMRSMRTSWMMQPFIGLLRCGRGSRQQCFPQCVLLRLSFAG